MKDFIFSISLIFFFFCASAVFAQDTILPSQHKFADNTVFIPKLNDETLLITMYMEYLKEGKKTIGFVHKDELDMIEEKKLTEKKMPLTDYQIVSITKREASVKIMTARGASLSCKLLTLRFYKNMYGFYYLIPGKVETFEKKMGDIILKEVFISTWTAEKNCN